MKPTRINVKVVENGYIIEADFPTGQVNQYNTQITESKQYVAYSGKDLDARIAQLNEEIPF